MRNMVDIRLMPFDNKLAEEKPQTLHEFDENLVAFHMKKTKLYLNKPIHLGM